VAYEQPRSDCVPLVSQVDVPEELLHSAVEIETVDEAIELYLEAYRMKFPSEEGLARKARRLRRFASYLEDSGHSMKLTDLRYEDGQRFMDSLVNAKDGNSLSLHNKRRLRGALRSLSRFLAAAGLLNGDLFFNLRIR